MTISEIYKINLTALIEGPDFKSFACSQGFDVRAGFTPRELKTLSTAVTQATLDKIGKPLNPAQYEVSALQTFTYEQLKARLKVISPFLGGEINDPSRGCVVS